MRKKILFWHDKTQNAFSLCFGMVSWQGFCFFYGLFYWFLFIEANVTQPFLCRAGVRRGNSRPCLGVLCLRDSQIQTHLLWQLVGESASQRLSQWAHILSMHTLYVHKQVNTCLICHITYVAQVWRVLFWGDENPFLLFMVLYCHLCHLNSKWKKKNYIMVLSIVYLGLYAYVP